MELGNEKPEGNSSPKRVADATSSTGHTEHAIRFKTVGSTLRKRHVTLDFRCVLKGASRLRGNHRWINTVIKM